MLGRNVRISHAPLGRAAVVTDVTTRASESSFSHDLSVAALILTLELFA